jgi:hypothetical protein
LEFYNKAERSVNPAVSVTDSGKNIKEGISQREAQNGNRSK